MKGMRLLTAAVAFILAGLALSAAAAPLQVFVSIPPQKWVADRVGRDLVATNVLLDRGQDPHTFEASPRQVSSLARAGLYFTVGLAFEDAMHNALKSAPVRLVDSSAGIERIPMQGRHSHEEDHEEGHAEGHGGEDDHHGQEHHDAGNNLDPHLWLSTANLQRMAGNMAAALAEADPANREVYQANLEDLRGELGELDSDLTRQLRPLAGATFYVFHPSFGYFARAYGLHQEAVEIDGKSPSPKQLAGLIRQAREEGVRTVFVQPQFDPKAATAFASAIEGSVVPLDPLAEDVAANLRAIAATLAAELR